MFGVVAAIALPACSGDDGNTLHVYSGRHYGIENAFERFEEETGVNVEFLTGNDAELRERIAAEGDDTKADVYLTVDAGNLAAATDQGLFRAIDSPTLVAAIPDEFSDADGNLNSLTNNGTITSVGGATIGVDTLLGTDPSSGTVGDEEGIESNPDLPRMLLLCILQQQNGSALCRERV